MSVEIEGSMHLEIQSKKRVEFMLDDMSLCSVKDLYLIKTDSGKIKFKRYERLTGAPIDGKLEKYLVLYGSIVNIYPPRIVDRISRQRTDPKLLDAFKIEQSSNGVLVLKRLANSTL